MFVFLRRLLSATFNRLSRALILPSASTHDRFFACGILTSTGITNDNLEDHWQATDFVAIQSLFNCAEGQSFWLCGTDIRSGPGFLLGDPGCDRLVFDPPPFEGIFDTTGPDAYLKLNGFKSAYIRLVIETASRLTSGDILCLVICGRGLPNGRVVVGDAEAMTLLVKTNLRMLYDPAKRRFTSSLLLATEGVGQVHTGVYLQLPLLQVISNRFRSLSQIQGISVEVFLRRAY